MNMEELEPGEGGGVMEKEKIRLEHMPLGADSSKKFD